MLRRTEVVAVAATANEIQSVPMVARVLRVSQVTAAESLRSTETEWMKRRLRMGRRTERVMTETTRSGGNACAALGLDHDLGERGIDVGPGGPEPGREIRPHGLLKRPDERGADRGVVFLDHAVLAVANPEGANGGNEGVEPVECFDGGGEH